MAKKEKGKKQGDQGVQAWFPKSPSFTAHLRTDSHDQACISVGTARAWRHLPCWVVLGQHDSSPAFRLGGSHPRGKCAYICFRLSFFLLVSLNSPLSVWISGMHFTLSASLLYASYVLDPCLKSEVCLFLLFFFFFLRVMFYLAGIFRTSSPRGSISSNPERTALREAASLYRSLATKGRWSERQRIIVS